MDDVACGKCSTMQMCDAKDCTTRATPVSTGAPSTVFVCSSAGHFCKKCNITWTQKRKAVTTKCGSSVIAIWMEGLAFSIETTTGNTLKLDATASFVAGNTDSSKPVCSASVKIVCIDGADGTQSAYLRYGNFSSRREIPVKYDTCRVTLETAETPLVGCVFSVVDASGKTVNGDATKTAFEWPGANANIRSTSVCVKRVLATTTQTVTNTPPSRVAVADRVAVRTTLSFGTLINAREVPVQSFNVTKTPAKTAAPPKAPKTSKAAKATAPAAKATAATAAAVSTKPDLNVGAFEDDEDVWDDSQSEEAQSTSGDDDRSTPVTPAWEVDPRLSWDA